MRKLGTTAGLLAASVMLVVWFSAGQTKEPGSNSAPRTYSENAPSRPLVLASSSCAGQACHGRAAPDPHPQSAWEKLRDDERWRSSYTIWRAYDPHAQAYAVLHEPASVRIAQRLWGPDAKAHEDVRCLACHSDSASFAIKDVAPSSGGVGCQSCHGNAKNWIDTHAGWPHGPGHAANAANHGLRNLSNVGLRAEVCAGCHVGAPATTDIPVRDMNHDMIAAGHPRLTFDYATYVRALPPHWLEKDRNVDPPRLRDSNEEFANWQVGRASTNAVSLHLLGDRAKRGPWPELAEFDCYSCHHELSPGTRRNSGVLNWQGPALLDPLQKLTGDRDLMATTAELRMQFRKPTQTAPIAELAERSASQWQHQAARWERNPLKQRDVASSFSEFSPHRWEDACHLYYSLLTIQRVRRPSQSPLKDERISRIRAALQLPRTVQGERFHSPKDFDSERLPFRELFRSIAGNN